VVLTDDVISTIVSLSTAFNGSSTGVDIDQVSATSGGTITVPSGTEVVFIQSSDTVQTTFTPPGDAPVLIFSGKGGVDVVINSGNTVDNNNGVDRIVIGSSGNDRIVINDAKDTQIVLGSGNSTIVAGLGDDTIVAGLGNATVSGGGGHDLVKMHGNRTNYHTAIGSTGSASGSGQPQATSTSHVVVTNDVTGVTTDITGVQYLQLDGSDALIFASSTVEAGVASLYQAAFGRTGEFGGISYWFDKAKAGVSLHDMAVGFTNSAEFQSTTAALTNAQFVSQLYQNTFGRAADSAGQAYWENQLSHGATRADLLVQFATVAALNEQGTLHTEATIVGSVTIVQNIV
jgi:hypothetical protein